MRLRLVRLPSTWQGPAGIEVAQRREMQTMDLPVPVQGLFHHQLGMAVDICGTERRLLVQRLII